MGKQEEISIDTFNNRPGHGYFPAIVRTELDSPIDALVALCVPRREAMDLVAASWPQSGACCLLATVDGGRPVVVLRTPQGRWAACNAFLNDLSATWQDADRRLHQLLKRHRHGYVACVGFRQAAASTGGQSELGLASD